ncbi:MAG: hypothetical protein V1921_06905 [Candidatus Altiarchaeota archaeon]
MRLLYFLVIAFLMSLLDILYTFTNVNILRKHTRHWKDTEYNPLVRSSWHIFGFFDGTVIAGALTLAVVLILSYMIGEDEFLQGFVIGIFVIVHHYHYINYAYIRQKYLNKKSSLVERILSNI